MIISVQSRDDNGSNRSDVGPVKLFKGFYIDF